MLQIKHALWPHTHGAVGNIYLVPVGVISGFHTFGLYHFTVSFYWNPWFYQCLDILFFGKTLSSQKVVLQSRAPYNFNLLIFNSSLFPLRHIQECVSYKNCGNDIFVFLFIFFPYKIFLLTIKSNDLLLLLLLKDKKPVT